MQSFWKIIGILFAIAREIDSFSIHYHDQDGSTRIDIYYVSSQTTNSGGVASQCASQSRVELEMTTNFRLTKFFVGVNAYHSSKTFWLKAERRLNTEPGEKYVAFWQDEMIESQYLANFNGSREDQGCWAFGSNYVGYFADVPGDPDCNTAYYFACVAYVPPEPNPTTEAAQETSPTVTTEVSTDAGTNDAGSTNATTSVPPTLPAHLPTYLCPCVCPLNQTPVVVPDSETTHELVEQIQTELQVDVVHLSSKTRRVSSAYDSRPSTQFIAYPAIAVILLPLLVIVCTDFIHLLFGARRLQCNAVGTVA